MSAPSAWPALPSGPTQSSHSIQENISAVLGEDEFQRSRRLIISQCEQFTEQLYELHKLNRVQQSQASVLLHPDNASSQHSMTVDVRGATGGSSEWDDHTRITRVRTFVMYMGNLPKVVRSGVNTDGLDKTCVRVRYVPHIPSHAIKPQVHHQSPLPLVLDPQSQPAGVDSSL